MTLVDQTKLHYTVLAHELEICRQTLVNHRCLTPREAILAKRKIDQIRAGNSIRPYGRSSLKRLHVPSPQA